MRLSPRLASRRGFDKDAAGSGGTKITNSDTNNNSMNYNHHAMKKPKKLSIKKLFSSPCHKCSTQQNKNAPQSPTETVASSVASPKTAGESPTVPTVLWSPAKENVGGALFGEHETILKENKQQQQQQQHNKSNNKNNHSSLATDDTRSTDSPRATAISLRRTNSGDTADLTVHSNTPPRDPEDDLGEGFLSTPSSLASSIGSNARNPYIFSDEDEDGDTSKNAEEEKEKEQEQEQEQTTAPPPPAETEAETETEPTAEPTIAADTSVNAETIPDAPSQSNGNPEERLDEEMRRFDERVRDQTMGERAVAKSQLATATAVAATATATANPEPEVFIHDSQQPNGNVVELTEHIQHEDKSCPTMVHTESLSPKHETRSKRRHRTKSRLDRDAARKRIRSCYFLSLLIPIVLLVPFLLVPETPAYHHDSIVDRANAFFIEATDKENPMKGITVVVSETTSALGRQLREKFDRLGATVASPAGLDCSDLASVSNAVDALLTDTRGSIDFLVHTGNLCLSPQREPTGIATTTTTTTTTATIQETIRSWTSTTKQGYDTLYAGNFLSSVLVTQKLLPRLEQSPFGTLVQFASPYATLVDGSQLRASGDTHDDEDDNDNDNDNDNDESSSSSSSSSLPASRLLQQHRKGPVAMQLLQLPVQFAYAKLSEVLQHREIARAHPRIRTMEVSSGSFFGGCAGGGGGGGGAVNSFFDRVFRIQDTHHPSYAAALSSPSMDDEDLQEAVYEWSQNAVWEWAAPSQSQSQNQNRGILDSLLLSGNHVASILPVDGPGDGTAAAATYLPSAKQTLTMVTSSTLAFVAMKAKNMASAGSWWSTE